MDNASSHKTKLIRDWFAKRLRWHMHFTPTSASWINQVERFFALLTDQQIKRGAHHSTAALEAAIAAYIDARNADPKPFRWTKTADDILASDRTVLSPHDRRPGPMWIGTSDSGHTSPIYARAKYLGWSGGMRG
jgi:hypothetical protein